MASGILGRTNEARGEYLKRHKRDLVWAEIGRAMGWAQGTLSNVKTGKRPIDIEEVPPLAEVLEVRAGWLFTGEGPMRDPEITEEAAALPPLELRPVESARKAKRGA